MNSKIQDLSNQGILVVPPLLQDTETLYMDNNSLTSLSHLPQTVKVLSAANNKLSLLPDLNHQTPLLTILNLSNNKLISIKGLINSKTIQELVICNNFIGDEEILSLKNLTNLKFLDVSRNHLRSQNFVKILQNLTGLEELRNNNNEFETWKIDYSLEKLKTLALENNKIEEIQFKEPMKSLEKFFCKQNRINRFAGFCNLKNLVELDVSENNLKEIPEDLGKTKVSVLLCNNNCLGTLPYLPLLEILDASNNSLFEILEFGGKIQEIVLSNNHLKDLPDMQSIISVNVAYNQFTSLTCVKNCRSLQSLDISFNPLIIPGTIIKDLSQTSLRNLTMPEPLPLEFREQIICQLGSLSELNKEIVPFRSFVSEKSNFRGSKYWDALSQSKLFPSCRSSMTGLTTPVNAAITYNSIFSDIKPTPLKAQGQLNRYENPTKEEVTGRFSADKMEFIMSERLDNTVKAKNNGNFILESGERNRSENRIKKTVNRKKKICTKVNCKKHKKEEFNKSALVDQSTSPFISQEFDCKISSKDTNNENSRILNRTSRVLNCTTKVERNWSAKGEFTRERKSDDKKINLAHLFTFARTPPRPVLTHESASPLTSKISPTSYEYSLVKELLYLEGYKLTSLSKTYTHSLHKSLEIIQSKNSKPKDRNLLFYFDKPDTLQTIFTYYKGFEFLWDSLPSNSINFSLSITRTTSNLNHSNTILLCLADPSSLSTSDNYLFTCASPSSIIPIYLINYS